MRCKLYVALIATALGGLLGSSQAAAGERAEGVHGTAVHFGKAWEAAHRATQENKLLLLVHISGMFEDPKFT
jgi:hypothetical protein